MAIFNDIFRQICDRFYTKERWNKHLYSSGHLHRKVNGHWPAFFPQRKLTRDEGIKLEKAFWEVIFTSSDNDNDNLYDYDYNDEGLDYSVRGAEIFPEVGELKRLLDILRSK